jgi:hypothetical protein
MINRRAFAKTVVGLLTPLILFGCATQTETYTTPTLKALLEAELPKHARLDQVIAILDRHHIDHSPGIYRGHDFPNDDGLFAAWAPTGRDFLIKKTLQVNFKFSKFNRLDNYSISDQFTGP